MKKVVIAALFLFSSIFSYAQSDDSDEEKKSKVPYLSLPKLNQEDAEVYFGSKARVAFFDFYRQMNDMKNQQIGFQTGRHSVRPFDRDPRIAGEIDGAKNRSLMPAFPVGLVCCVVR